MTAIRFAGSGGQGVQLAGIILAEAAVASGWHAACTQTYGPESRGGSSRADVILSRSEIDFPCARQIDVLVALSPEGFPRQASALREGGTVICERSIQPAAPEGVAMHALPILDTARNCGSVQTANVVALGAVCAMTGVIPRQAVAEALSARLHRLAASNRRALEAGWGLGEELAAVSQPAASAPGYREPTAAVHGGSR